MTSDGRGLGRLLRRRASRRTVLGGAAVVAAAGTAGGVWAASGDDPPQHRRSTRTPASTVAARWLTFADDPARDVYVSWSAGPKADRHPDAAAIRWGTEPTDRRGARVSSRRVPTAGAADGVAAQPTYYSRAHLTGLRPATTYYYAVTSDGRHWTPDATFHTAPAQKKAFRFTAFGDQASHEATSVPMSRLVAKLGPAFHLVAGDLSYASAAGGDKDPSVATFEPDAWDRYVANITHAASATAWVPVVGSHEIEPLGEQTYAGFLTRFPQRHDASSGSPVVRSFVYGNVGFVQLDGNDVSMQERANAGYTHGRQTKWLAATLDHLRNKDPNVDFIVVICNICAYSSNYEHGSDGGARREWVPLFDEYAVDLVISGHVHAYERTHPMRGGRRTKLVPPGGRVVPDRSGTTYICCGGGGNGLYKKWYGPTSSGDQAARFTAPIVYELDAAGKPKRVVDRGEIFSAHRQAVYSCLVIDVNPGTGPGSNTVLRVQAVAPEQRGGTITDFTKFRTIDSVHIVRTAV